MPLWGNSRENRMMKRTNERSIGFATREKSAAAAGARLSLRSSCALIDAPTDAYTRKEKEANIYMCVNVYSQVVVYVGHVRPVAERLDERLLRLVDAALGAQHASQVPVCCGQRINEWFDAFWPFPCLLVFFRVCMCV